MTETTTFEKALPENITDDSRARAILSVITEPGDTDTGRLLAQLGAADALHILTDEDATAPDGYDLTALHQRTLPRYDGQDIAAAFLRARQLDVHLVTPDHEHWPSRMNDLGDLAPVALWVRGDITLLQDSPAIAVVGARAATGYGEHVTVEIVSGLVDRGYTIASGAAYGIDGTAHRSALASGGRTIAYLAGGVDRFYPSGHEALLGRIVEHGAVVAEVPCGIAPTRWRFLMRNRLIAANSDATLVTEAGWRSGSLNTAGHASNLGRPVGAVPGPVTSAASAGTARLIRDYGAALITTAGEAAEL